MQVECDAIDAAERQCLGNFLTDTPETDYYNVSAQVLCLLVDDGQV